MSPNKSSKNLDSEKLRDSEEKFRQFFENSNDAIFIADSQTRRLVDCNKKAEKLVGRSKAEILSMRADNLHPTDRVKETMEGFKKQIEGKAEFVETEVLTKTGKRIYVEVNASTVQISGKKYLLGIFRNITDRKQAEEKIKLFSDAVAGAFDYFLLTDMKGNITYANESAFRAFGYTLEEFLRLNIGKLDADPRVGKKVMQEMMVKGKWSGEVMNIRKNKEKFPSLLSAFIIKNEKGNPKGTMGILREITERKKAEEEIKKATDELQSKVEEMTDASNALLNMTEDLDETNKKLLETQSQLKKSFNELKELDVDKDRFISIAAHELKTPMTAIHGFAQLLENEKVIENDEIRNKYLKIIETEIKRLSKMVTEVLDLSRIDLGTMKFTIEAVDVAKLMEEVRDEMKEKAKEKGLKLGFNVGSELTILRTDREKLKEVLINLVDDAIKYTEKGGITFEACKEDKNIIFSVADTGIGISKKYFNKLFTRFYQVASPLTRRVGGTGLGLSISKELVESLGGRIWLKSKVDKGTTFYFTLPLKAKNKP